MAHVELISVDDSNNLLFYNDSKLIDVININLSIKSTRGIFHMDNEHILIFFGYKEKSDYGIIIFNIVTMQIIYEKDDITWMCEIFNNMFLIGDVFGFNLVSLNKDTLIYEPTNLKGKLVSHVTFDAKLIKDFVIDSHRNNILTYDNQIITKIKSFENSNIIGCIENMIIHLKEESIVLQVYDNLNNLDNSNNTEWDLKSLFSIDLNKVTSILDARMYYTSISIIACVVTTNNVAHIALIRIFDYDEIDVENYLLTNIHINENIDIYPEVIYVSDLDDYSFVLNITLEYGYYDESTWIYQSRISPVTYRGKGSSALINHTKYIKEIKKELEAHINPYLFAPLINLVNYYI